MTVRTTSLLGREQKKQVTADCSDAVRTLLSNTSISTQSKWHRLQSLQHNAAGAKRPSSAGAGKKAAPSKAEQVSTSYFTLAIFAVLLSWPTLQQEMLGAVKLAWFSP